MPSPSQAFLLAATLVAVVAAVLIGFAILKEPALPMNAANEIDALRLENRRLREEIARLKSIAVSEAKDAPFEVLAPKTPVQGPKPLKQSLASTDSVMREPAIATLHDQQETSSIPEPMELSDLFLIPDVDKRKEAVDEFLANLGFWDRSEAIQELMAFDPGHGFEAIHAFLESATHEWKGEWGARSLVRSLGEILDQVEDYPITRDLYQIHASQLEGVSMVAAQILDKRGDPSLMVLEIERFARDLGAPEISKRLKAIQNIGSTGSPKAIPYLTPLLHHSSWEIKIATLKEMAHLGNESHIPFLERLLNDPEPSVRDTTVKTIRRLRGRSPQ